MAAMETVGDPRPSPTTRHAPGSRVNMAVSIPDYELLHLIGKGSYGEVWLARGVTDAFRTVKIVWRDRFADAAPFEREFNGLREFATLPFHATHHLGVAHVGKNEVEGFFYCVMELADDVVTGRIINPSRYAPLTLSSMRAHRGNLPIAECIAIGAGLARGLADLHASGLVHRDIKPSNVIFINGVPKLADIGLVARATAAQTFVGTEGFIPPEGPGTASADVYALGKLLYEIATGLDRQDFPRLPPSLDALPERKQLLELNEIILRACAVEPAQRYRDASTLLADLLALDAGKSMRRINRWREILALGRKTAALLALGVGVLVAWNYLGRTASTPPVAAATAEADRLLAQVASLTDGVYSRHSVLAAEQLARRATELAPQSARAWGALAYCDACHLLRNWDLSVERRQAVQNSVNRALAIDRNEPTALLASAILLRRQNAHAQSEMVARRGLAASPDDPRLWRVLSHSIFNQDRRDEAISWAQQAQRKFPLDPLVHYDLALLYSQMEDFARFEANIDAALALKPFQAALITKVDVAIFRRGDLKMARETLAQFPAEERGDDRVVACAMNLAVLERDPTRVHEAAALTASSYFTDFVARGGPKAFWRALAFQQEKKPALERAQWQEAEDVLRKRQRDQTAIPSDQARLATALVWLGKREEAQREIAAYEAAFAEQPSVEQAVMLGIYYASLGDAKKAVPILRTALNRWGGVSYHGLLLHPWWDNVRGQSEFADLLQEASASPP